MRTLYDGITAGNLPTNAEIVGGYVEGRYVWSQADWNRFPNSIKVTIAIYSADADVLDIETGDATPAMAPAWVKRQRERGAFPTVYCNRSTWPAVEKALAAAGFRNGTHYDLWLADYTQTPHCPPYAAACQYADPGPYDLSLCQDYWPRGAQDMTPEQDALLRQVFNFLKYGSDGTVGESRLNILGSEIWNFHAFGASKTGGQTALATDRLNDLQKTLATLEGKVQVAPAIDVAALAAALTPHLPPTIDVAAVAQAVVNEIGVRVRPA